MKGLTSKELRAWTPPYQPYIIGSGILVPGTKMIIYGKFQSWKSMLAMHTSYCIANGKDWFGFPTTKTPTFTLQIEVPQAEMKVRVEQYLNHNPEMECDQNWFCTEPYIKLDKGYGHGELEREIGRTGAKVVFIDPAYKVISGHITDLYDLSQFTDRIDLLIAKYNISVIIVHHPRKAQTFEGKEIDMGGDDMFGTYLQNWCDTCIRTTTTDIDGELILTFIKARHAHDLLKPFAVKVDRKTLMFRRLQ